LCLSCFKILFWTCIYLQDLTQRLVGSGFIIVSCIHHPPARSGGQQEAVQGRGGKRPPGRPGRRRPGLEQTQDGERVHHRSAVPGTVQVHRAVPDLPPQVTHLRDLHVPVTAPGVHQQVFPAGKGVIVAVMDTDNMQSQRTFDK